MNSAIRNPQSAIVVAEGVYRPQSIAELRDRFALAIDHVHFPSDIAKPQSEWPAQDPIHFFDFENGMRLIVSRNEINLKPKGTWVSHGPTLIHVSASMNPESKIYRQMSPLVNSKAWKEVIIGHLQQISNFVGEVEDQFIGEPPKNILHLFFREIR